MASGTLYKTEVYKLIDSRTGNEYPVKATIKYYRLGPNKTVEITVPGFTTSDGTSYSELKVETDSSFAPENILKDEAITILISNWPSSLRSPILVNPPESIDPPPPSITPTTTTTSTPTSWEYFVRGVTTNPPTPTSPANTDPDADLVIPEGIESEIIVSEDNPKVLSYITPTQINQVSSDKTKQSEDSQIKTDINQPDAQVIKDNTPTNLEPPVKEKIAKTINKKSKELKTILIPTLISVLTSVGAEYVASQIVLSDTCAVKPITDRAIKIRNQVVEKLNSIVKILDTVSLVLTGLTLAAALYESTRKKVKTARQAASIAAAAIPPPAGVPGQVVSTLNTLKDVEEETEKNSYKITSTLVTINLYVASLNAVLVLVMSLLAQLDQYIDQCAPNSELIPLSPILLTIQQNNNQIDRPNFTSVYNNFILEIEEEPFTPTVNRRRAVAKNSQGIVIIATPYSFTTLKDVLIQELKLLIDTNNLKAD